MMETESGTKGHHHDISRPSVRNISPPTISSAPMPGLASWRSCREAVPRKRQEALNTNQRLRQEDQFPFGRGRLFVCRSLCCSMRILHYAHAVLPSASMRVGGRGGVVRRG